MIRIFVALLALLMAPGAVAQKKPTTPSFDGNDIVTCNGINDNDSGLPSGTSFMCKNPKTGKVVNIECKVPPKMAQKMPKKMSGAELIEVCSTAKTSLKDVIITS